MKIEVVDYDPGWPEKYLLEKSLLLEKLGDVVIKIHHIGSTAVPSLAAKPIIDIMIEVGSLRKLDKLSSEIESLGYDAMGEFGIPGRRYFKKGGDNRTHQIHAFEVGDSNIFRHIAFRNYLIAHPDVMAKYEKIKRELAISCKNDIDIYCDGKDEFIKYHEAKAIELAKNT